MAAPSSGALPDAVFTVLVQICGAFAQGADGLFVDDAVILQARKDYTPVIERDLDSWPTDGPRILLLTRAMGRMAAASAMADGRVTIALKHYRAARRAVHLTEAGCPFHLPIRR